MDNTTTNHFEEDDDDDYLSSTPSFSRTPKIFDRFGSSSSSDDEFLPSSSSSSHFTPNSSSSNGVVKAAGKKLDYMIQFLDRKLSKVNSNNGGVSAVSGVGGGSLGLPEFVGSGGGTGIFRLPVRSAVRPDRPPCVEVRPHPRRETQVGRWLKTIMCSEKQLWSGGESGVRCWELNEIFSANEEEEEEEGCLGEGRLGDEMSSRFRESVEVVSEVVCMVGDEGERVVWSGHKDGRIMCWRMEDGKKNGFKECLSWQAHKGPVFSLVMTSYGEHHH